MRQMRRFTLGAAAFSILLVAGAPEALAQRDRRERGREPQASPPPQQSSNDRRTREQPQAQRPAPAPQPAPAPRAASQQRPTPAPSPAPSMDRRTRQAPPPESSPAPAPTPAPTVDRRSRQQPAPAPTPRAMPESIPAPAPTPAPAPDVARRSRPAPTPAPSGNFDRRTRQSPPAAPAPQRAPDSAGTTPAPATPPATIISRRSRATPAPSPSLAPTIDRRTRQAPPAAPRGDSPRRDPLPPVADRGGNGAPSASPVAERSFDRSRRGSGRGFNADASPGGSIVLPPAFADARDSDRVFATRDYRRDGFRDHDYASRRPIEIIRRPGRADDCVTPAYYDRSHWRRPLREICPTPIVVAPRRHHWWRPTYWSACDTYVPAYRPVVCRPTYFSNCYSPYTLFPAPIWPGPSWTSSSWPLANSFSLGLSFFSHGSSLSIGGSAFYSTPLYSSSYCSTSYCPTPFYATPVYSTPLYSTPLYSSGVAWYDSGTSWYSGSSVETFTADPAPVASTTPAPTTPATSLPPATASIRVLTDEIPPRVPTSAGVLPSTTPTTTVSPASSTLYRAQTLAGQLHWSDTPTSIVESVLSARDAQRADAASKYLGRSPVGAWEVTFEKWQRTTSATELTCRAALPIGTGWRPTILLRVKDAALADQLKAGQRLTVTGALAELSVDDPAHPGGLLVLEAAEVR